MPDTTTDKMVPKRAGHIFDQSIPLTTSGTQLTSTIILL